MPKIDMYNTDSEIETKLPLCTKSASLTNILMHYIINIARYLTHEYEEKKRTNIWPATLYSLWGRKYHCYKMTNKRKHAVLLAKPDIQEKQLPPVRNSDEPVTKKVPLLMCHVNNLYCYFKVDLGLPKVLHWVSKIKCYIIAQRQY